MNHCKNTFMSSGFVTISCDDPMDFVVCPKPRRVANNVVPLFRLHSSHLEGDDSKAGEDLLDIIRRKDETLSTISSSPPFFLGSPPSRATNPLAQDARFGNERLNSMISPSISISPRLSSPFSSRVNGGSCGRVKFGLIKPAAVRVEGFDCLTRDSQNSSIPAMA